MTKTWGRDEEVAGRESYSRRLGVPGALLLNLAMVWSAIGLAVAVRGSGAAGTVDLAGWPLLLLGTTAAGIAYALRPERKRARVFRGTMTAFIVLFYGVVTAAAIR